MEPVSLPRLADELLEKARKVNAGRQARTLFGGQEHHLRQTMIAIAAGHGLDDHESPGEATLHVLRGRADLVAGEDRATLAEGDHVVIPPVRHSVEVSEDTVLLLTTAVDVTSR